MKLVLPILLLCACASAATLQGVIFDEESRNPLARATVILLPLPGNPAEKASILSNDRGAYAFTAVQPGWYLIRAERVGYAVSEFGGSHPGRPGTPIEVTANIGADSHPIVMRHLAVVSGTVVDDNTIGIPDWPVNVYTARQPIRRVAQVHTDDRGDFRVAELAAGAYLVRSGGGGLDGISSLVPAYFKYGTAVANAEAVRVRLGETLGYVVIHTVEGQLYELTGTVVTPDNRPAVLTLTTDTDRHVISSVTGEFAATGVPPGMAELLVQGAGCAGYQRIMVDRNTFARVDCRPLSAPVVEWRIGEEKTTTVRYPLTLRRVDLDGPLPERTLAPGETIPPGHWEVTVRNATAHYVVSVQGDEKQTAKANDGWFEIDAGNAPHILITLSSKPASVSGVVSSGGGPVLGAPVYMELFAPDTGQTGQSWSARTDARGNYTFSGLPPGSYRLLSSFDLDFDDPAAREKAVTVILREGDAASQSLAMIQQ